MYSSIVDTIEHKKNVRKYMKILMFMIENRADFHDLSKLQEPELSIFNKYTPKLKECTYGSDEYKENLKQMNVALEHHYRVNEHHPEHYENGIKGMNLVDLIEMLCDWKAACMRHSDGDIMKSIEINQERFGYGDELKEIFVNTVRILGDKVD